MIQGLANLRAIFETADIDLEFLAVILLDMWMKLVPMIVDKMTGVQKLFTEGEKYFDCLLVMFTVVTAISGF